MPHPDRGASPRPPARRRRLLAVAVLAWAAVLGLGARALMRHAFGAGDPGRPPPAWPPASALAREPGRPTLAVFLHPHCPCSRVTVAELAGAIDRATDRPVVHVLLAVPGQAPAGWERTPLAGLAARLPGATVRVDRGREAALFGARTSGHVLLFDADGRRVFSGGVTDGRGHAGPSPGRAAVVGALSGGDAPAPEAPVFGCPLFPDNDP
jgi:hypothetical protein